MNNYIITEVTMKRFDIFSKVINKQLLLTEASSLLGLSYRHTIRLFNNFKLSGIDALVKKYNNSGKNIKVDNFMEKKIINLRTSLYPDFNINHFNDKLKQVHNIHLSYETIRQLLIKHNLHTSKKRKKVYRRRRRMPNAGLMLQMDSSLHNWLEHIKKKYYLIAAIDDATNEIPFAFFSPADTTFANMYVIRQIIEKKGIFGALYVDKASHFVTTRHSGLHQYVDSEQQDTNIAKALKELGITLILANSPQAKGRIERSFRFMQDRLIKEMRLKNIRNYEEANKYMIKEFLPWYNKNYKHRGIKSEYKRISEEIKLDKVFTKREYRKLKKDNTIVFYGERIQLPLSSVTLTYRKPSLEIRYNVEGELYIIYKGVELLKTRIDKTIIEKAGEKDENFLSKRIIA